MSDLRGITYYSRPRVHHCELSDSRVNVGDLAHCQICDTWWVAKENPNVGRIQWWKIAKWRAVRRWHKWNPDK